MQVTHVEENIQNVVIGGGKSRSFAIATTSEFVTVLSDSLYSNKNLAVVREVMCNAWDAHISAGKTDTPILVTINNNTLSIRDYGSGIPDAMMEDVYCTYGESTKNRETQTTGGFGLGSKSPFAISDNFSVTSFNNGTKTLYAVSKGGMETDGLPELRPIVAIPTDETGLLVEVPLDPAILPASIKDLAMKVALYGEMNANIALNDKVEYIRSDQFGLKNSELGFMIRKSAPVYGMDHRTTPIYIQYGSVVYHVVTQESYDKEYFCIADKLTRKPRSLTAPTYNTGVLVIQAQGSSLSVAPSRETLSYNKTTIQAIKVLLQKVLDEFNKIRPNLYKEVLDINFQHCVNIGSHSTITNYEELINFLDNVMTTQESGHPISEEDYLNTRENMHKHFLLGRYKMPSNYFRSYYCRRALAHVAQFKNARWTKIAKAILFPKQSLAYNNNNKPWGNFHWRVTRDLYEKFGKDFMQHKSIALQEYRELIRWNTYDPFSHQAKYKTFRPFEVLIANSMYNARVYLEKNRTFRREYHYIHLVLLNKTQKKYDPDEVAAFLTEKGYKVHAAYADESLQPKRSKKTTASTTAKRSLKGYAKLKSCVDSNSLRYGKFETAERITNPDAVVKVATRNNMKEVDGFADNHRLQILLHYFPNTVLVTSAATLSNVRAKYKIKEGRSALTELLQQKLDDPVFVTNIATSMVAKTSPENNVYMSLAKIPDIRQEFGLVDLTKPNSEMDEQLYNTFYYSLPYDFRSKWGSTLEAAQKQVEKGLHNMNLILNKKPHLSMLNDYNYKYYSSLSVDKQTMLTKLIKVILKG